MEYLRIMGLCAVALIPFVLLKKHAPEQGILFSLAVVLVVVLRCIELASPLLRLWEAVFQRAGLEEMHIDILLRTVVLAMVSQLCAGLCRDAGSQVLAALVEISSGVAALIVAMPLLETVLALLMRYFG